MRLDVFFLDMILYILECVCVSPVHDNIFNNLCAESMCEDGKK